MKFFNEIIVYLDDHSIISSEGNSELWLDFRSSNDVERFLEYLRNPDIFARGLNQVPSKFSLAKRLKDASYIHVTNISTTRRLRSGAYYALNVDCLNHGMMSVDQDNTVSFLKFDFAGVEKECCLGLLQKHGLLEPLNIESIPSEEFPSGRLPDIDGKQLKLTVADVGQANMNILSVDGKPSLIFDAGAPLTSSRQQVSQIISKYLRSAKDCTLVISHWDLDHYKCLMQMTGRQMSIKFRQVICSDQTKSVSSQRILERLRSVLGGRVFCLRPPERERYTPYPVMHPFARNGRISIYIGEYSTNINYCGMNVFIDGTRCSVQMTGDCMLAQADDVISNQFIMGQLCSPDHVLVAPHHGGYLGEEVLRYNSKSHINPYGAVISVGADNRYGHPAPATMNFLAKVFSCRFHLTSLSGTFSYEI